MNNTKKLLVIFVALSLIVMLVFPNNAPIANHTGMTNVALANSSIWPMFRYNRQHTGQCPYDTSKNNGGLKWRYGTGWDVNSSPAIGSDGTIYVGSDDRYLYALNPDGSLKWRYETGDRVNSSPAIGSDGTIYVGSWDGYLYAIGKITSLTVSTKSATITSNSVILNGNLTDMGGDSSVTVYFEWGTDRSYGNKTTQETMNAAGTFHAKLTNLFPDTKYHYRTVATNSVETVYGDDMAFTTPSDFSPTTPPSAPSNLTATAGNQEVTLTWSPSTQGTYPINGYAIYRGTSAGGESDTPIAP